MTILEQLNAINDTFADLHAHISGLYADKESIEQKYSSRQSLVSAKWVEQRSLLSSQKETVMKYYRIAKENSYNELRPCGVCGLYPDIALLNRMIMQINDSNRNDPVAGQVIDLVCQYMAYLDNELSQLSIREQAECRELDVAKSKELSALASRASLEFEKCKSYLNGDNITELSSSLKRLRAGCEINDDYFRACGQNIDSSNTILLGFTQFPLDVPQSLSDTLKGQLGRHFDSEAKAVDCPYTFAIDRSVELFIEYTGSNEALVKKGLQALVLNYLRCFKPIEFKVSLLDYIHYNADLLGPVSALASEKDGIIEKPGMTAQALQQSISLLADHYRKIENRIGTLTLRQYNNDQLPANRLPYRILIINRIEDAFRTTDSPEMSYLINNAEKLGITIIHMTKKSGSRTGLESTPPQAAEDRIVISSDTVGGFLISNRDKWLAFKWLDTPDALPSDFIEKIRESAKPAKLGTRYFSRFSMGIPSHSIGVRKPISIPFSIDENDNVISCNFNENDMFAAYIMGAAGSGKSTLLHTIICGLIMNYHPDEVELWLLDFKMLEFKRYTNHLPPHVKYILLEKSEDLVFDIIDQLTELLKQRQFLFSQNGWRKITDVPLDRNMPTIFVIIDEFAQMSQIIKETKGAGHGLDYTLKLENLLTQGRALGFKFIFASQTYTTGVSGLTDVACKQIQLRFAMKNTPDEIKQTLRISSNDISPELNNAITSLPKFETIFQWVDEEKDEYDEDRIHTGRYRNMYALDDEIDAMVDRINAAIKPVPPGGEITDATYIDKKPVLIDGSQPKTFASQIPYYKEYEAAHNTDEYDDEDIPIYAGVPCSFVLARPFTLCSLSLENILIAGGGRDGTASVLLSIINCYKRKGHPIEIWAHERSPLYRKYRHTALAKYTQRTDLDEICGQIAGIKNAIAKRRVPEKLIICIGYDNLASDMEIFGEGIREPVKKEVVKSAQGDSMPDMSELLQRLEGCESSGDPAAMQQIMLEIDEYNRLVAGGSQPMRAMEADDEFEGVYDAREDMKWILRRASNYGLHFVFCFDRASDFLNLRLDEKSFRHKILFPMSKDESFSIIGSRRANEIDDGVCVYSDGKDSFAFRPHIYPQISYNGWTIDENGNIIQGR